MKQTDFFERRNLIVVDDQAEPPMDAAARKRLILAWAETWGAKVQGQILRTFTAIPGGKK